jgi:hypothetical protein
MVRWVGGRYGIRVGELHSLAAKWLAYMWKANRVTELALLDDLLGLALSLRVWVSRVLTEVGGFSVRRATFGYQPSFVQTGTEVSM